MNVTLAEMTMRLAASPAHSMADTTIDAETTRLARQAQAGSAEAFCALVDLHQRAARRIATIALGQSPEVDEAVQDACMTAWQRLERLEDPAAFRAWLLRITWRKALDRRRSLTGWLTRFGSNMAGRGWRSTANEGQGGGLANQSPLDHLADPAPLADQQLVSRERDLAVAQMIRSLPPRLRDPFLLAATGEHRYEDVAAMLGIPLGTVKWRVAEARRVLRDKLARVGFGQERGPHGSRTGK
ncbi:MAG TPA: RNA polymerase sigma factor [Vicinamibacterales bacterium]|nr:RNA polymerase sigma factor [Vicinamibacterales bacterium]